jgi:formate hydrogenlyase subunit 3/multisubunit Na+/H+ antiporter MnhD subunit
VISLLVFYAHTIAAVVLFTTRWQDSNWKEGLLAVGFLALVFSVGWSMSTFVMKLLVDEKGFAVWLDRDALSLLLLAAAESVFFYAQMKRRRRHAARGVSPSQSAA